MSYPKYVSIDIETTGLDPETCQILEIGIVVEDWQTPIEDLPCLTFLVNPGIIVGEPYALRMNAEILGDIHDLKYCKVVSQRGCGDMTRTELAAFEMKAFLREHFPTKGRKVHFLAAGKNFAGFDLRFLERLPHWQKHLQIDHRTLDPGPMYFDPEIDDRVPGTAECLRRAGLDPDVKHRALEDARDVVRLIRKRTMARQLASQQ